MPDSESTSSDAITVRRRKVTDYLPDARKTFIYILVDPRDGQVRYVGKFNDPQLRLRAHVSRCNMSSSHLYNWISVLKRLLLRPQLFIVEHAPKTQWQDRERYWIAFFRSQGADLTNTVEGGIAPEITLETRKKMSAARMGKAPHNKGKKTPQETREKQSIAARNRWRQMPICQRNQYIERLQSANHPTGAAVSGWHHTKEALEKISKSSRGNKRGALLTRSDIQKIRKFLDSLKIKQNDIAVMFGVSPQIISNIKHGRSYADW